MRRNDFAVHCSYPLASGSRARRRRLLMRIASLDQTDTHSRKEASTAKLSGSPGNVGPAEDAVQRLQPTPQFHQIRDFVEATRAVTWVFTGDDATHGACGTNGGQSYPEIVAQRIRWDLRRLLDVVINTGVHGGRIKNLLKNLKWRVSRFRPDVASVMVGMRDCTVGPSGRTLFRQCLAEIVEQLQERNAVVVLNTPGKILLPSASIYADLPAYVDLIRDVASKHNVALIDHWAYWEQCLGTDDALANWLATDGIHPNAQGHRALAKLIFERSGIDESNRQARASAARRKQKSRQLLHNG